MGTLVFTKKGMIPISARSHYTYSKYACVMIFVFPKCLTFLEFAANSNRRKTGKYLLVRKGLKTFSSPWIDHKQSNRNFKFQKMLRMWSFLLI